KLGQQGRKLPKAHERFSAYERNVHRPIMVDQAQDPLHQRVTPIIADLSQKQGTAEMVGIVSIAAGTREGAFPRYFDREVGNSAAEDSAPSLEDFMQLH